MIFLDTMLLAAGLSMDSMAVSITGGAVIGRCTMKSVMRIASAMGLFQAGMTVLGYLLGMGFEQYISDIDHWIAFLLLTAIGIKAIYESFNDREEPETHRNPFCNKTLCGLAIATSIDAFAVGITFAILNYSIFMRATTIGIITFVFSAFGVYFGSHFGRKMNLNVDLIGGIFLICIGLKILLEHIWFTS
ncbi:manganese efflux pump MntP [Massilibacteroides vaginae]|uniref:manganese efflux pump MntP n=1 Tax=Massilibacteroides vaginae TaxID=1673718 RepID=UPI000A1C8F2D|nr:manganese efflux pump MntP family protein [Massilibacteroides vaginae]